MSGYSLVVVSACALAWSLQTTPVPKDKPQEHWVNSGVTVEPPTNLTSFTKKFDGAIVGVLEKVSMAFLNEADPNTLHTVLTLRVNEWMFGDELLRKANRVEIFVQGGTFVEVNGKRTPTRPVQYADTLTIGAEYFIPLERGDKFGKERTGRLVGDLTVMSRLANGDVSPVIRHVRWPSQVIATARAAAAVPGPTAASRDVFLSALRAAGKEKR
jgi:hypothetical protein